MTTAILLVSLAGLYALWSVGVTGGPNHGEHPMIVSILHLGVFLWFGRAWANPSYALYLVGLLAALAVSFLAFGASTRPKRQWTCRALLAAIYAGLLAVLVLRP